MTRVQATGLSSTTVGWSRLGASVSFELPLCFNRPLPAPLPPISLHCETSLHSLGHLSHSSLLHSHMLHCTHYPAVHCASVESVHLAACIHFAALSLVSSPVALSSACQKIHCILLSTELHCILLSTSSCIALHF